jgi:hypothetical protein
MAERLAIAVLGVRLQSKAKLSAEVSALSDF